MGSLISGILDVLQSQIPKGGREVPNWDDYFMSLASVIKTRSKDPNTQVGCVIVGPNNEIRTTGYNALPFNVLNKPERFERPEKYKWTEHAERNAIYLAARIGTSVAGCRIYQPGLPCIDCARAIVQAGIVEVIHADVPWGSSTVGPDYDFVKELLYEAGVKIRVFKGTAAPIAEAA